METKKAAAAAWLYGYLFLRSPASFYARFKHLQQRNLTPGAAEARDPPFFAFLLFRPPLVSIRLVLAYAGKNCGGIYPNWE